MKFKKTNAALCVDGFITPKKNMFFVHPNPPKENVNYTIFCDISTKVNITLFNITGKVGVLLLKTNSQ